MSLMFGTVSYLPDNELRQLRKERSIRTFKCYGELAKCCGEPLNIVTTNWTDEEWDTLVLDMGVEGISLNRVVCTTLGCAFAKGLLYDEFYSSDYDYLFVGDDDMVVYPYYGFSDCLKEVHTNPDKFMGSGIKLFTCIKASVLPFKEANMYDLDFCSNWVFTYKNINTLGYPTVICNTQKYLGKRVKPICEGVSLGFREDMSFTAESMKLGIIPYTLTSFIATTFSNDDSQSAIHYSNRTPEEELEYRKFLNDEFISVYPKAFIDRATNWMNVSPYLPPNFPHRVLVSREKEYVFTEQDIVKKRGGSKIKSMGLLKK